MRVLTLLCVASAMCVTACGDDSGGPIDAGADSMVDASDGSPDSMVDPLPVDPAFDDIYTSVGDGMVVTTLTETLGPRYGWEQYVDEEGRVRVPLDEFGVLHPQPGEPHMLRDQLVVGGWSR